MTHRSPRRRSGTVVDLVLAVGSEGALFDRAPELVEGARSCGSGSHLDERVGLSEKSRLPLHR